MWWKIYFWSIIVLAILTGIDSFAKRFDNFNIFFLFHQTVFYVEIAGFYAYLFVKQYFTRRFWFYFFWLNVGLDVLFLLYALFPHTLLSPYLKTFFVTQPKPDIFLAIGELLDIPMLYAIYQLSKNKYYQPKAKKNKNKQKKETRFQWGMLQMALWGYSSILTFLFFLLSFVPQNGKDTTTLSFDPFFLAIFSPLLFFWFWVIIRYKQYKWNWWRTTLIANAIFYSGSIIFGIVFPQPVSDSSGFNIITSLQLLILLISYYEFGKDQFGIVDQPNSK
jgi:hypothetical protein